MAGIPSINSGKGPSSSETAIQGSTQNFMSQLQQDFGTTFANQQNILSGLQNNLTSIFNAGPSQFGFSAPETSALNTLATSQNALGYQQAKAAAGSAEAAAGGSAQLPTGANAAEDANLAQKAAQQQSNSLLGIQEAGYQQGRQNWQTSLGGLENVASQENPGQYAQQANQAGSQAFGEANTIQQQTLAANPWPQIGGLAGSLAGAALNMVAPGAGTGLSSLTKDIGQGYQNAGNMSTDAGGLDYGLGPITPQPTQNLTNLPYYGTNS